MLSEKIFENPAVSVAIPSLFVGAVDGAVVGLVAKSMTAFTVAAIGCTLFGALTFSFLAVAGGADEYAETLS